MLKKELDKEGENEHTIAKKLKQEIMAYKQEPGRAPMDAYSPFQKVGLIRPGKKNKKKEVYGQNKKYLTAKQRRNRGFIAPSGVALGTVLLANENTRRKISDGVKNIVQKFF